MLAETRFRAHFDLYGSWDTHHGPFVDRAAGLCVETVPAAAAGGGCCC
jgi:hypothetical protein